MPVKQQVCNDNGTDCYDPSDGCRIWQVALILPVLILTTYAVTANNVENGNSGRWWGGYWSSIMGVVRRLPVYKMAQRMVRPPTLLRLPDDADLACTRCHYGITKSMCHRKVAVGRLRVHG